MLLHTSQRKVAQLAFAGWEVKVLVKVDYMVSAQRSQSYTAIHDPFGSNAIMGPCSFQFLPAFSVVPISVYSC